MAAFAEKSGHEGEAATDDADAELHGTVDRECELVGLLVGCNGWGMNLAGNVLYLVVSTGMSIHKVSSL